MLEHSSRSMTVKETFTHIKNVTDEQLTALLHTIDLTYHFEHTRILLVII